MTAFNLPDLGEGLQSAEVVAWHVAEGEHVVVDQPLVSIETEKAVVEIPSPQAGRVARLLARPGERIDVGAPLLEFETGPFPDAGTVVGDLGSAGDSPPSAAVPARLSGEASSNVRASPAVRAKARELGIDLTTVTPSGPDGAITIVDLTTAAATAPASGGAALRGARRTMALNMGRAWREVAHATLYDEADIAVWTGHDVTLRLIRAIVAGCKAEPNINAGFDATGLCLKSNEHIDLGLAIDGPDGLFVPVLRDVGQTAAADWRRQIDFFKEGVQNRSLKPADLRNPTITLSNFGMIAGTHAALVIVPPQVAILGAGRICDRPARDQSGIALHSTLPLSLTFDHRAVTGGEAARFLRAVIDDLQRAT